jgi:hypothetical protein
LEGNCIRLDNGHVSQPTGCLPSPKDTVCGYGSKEFNKLNILLPISSFAETKGMKVTFFLIYAWIFLLELQKIRIRAKSQSCDTKFFLLSTGNISGLRFYYKQTHFEFVPRRTQSDCSKNYDGGTDKCALFGPKTAEVTSDWKKIA